MWAVYIVYGRRRRMLPMKKCEEIGLSFHEWFSLLNRDVFGRRIPTS